MWFLVRTGGTCFDSAVCGPYHIGWCNRGRCGHRPLQGAYGSMGHAAPHAGPSRMPAPTSIITDGAYRRCTMIRCAGRCGHRPLQGVYVSRTIPLTKLPAGLRGLWPSHRNNAKHGLRALPNQFCSTGRNHYNIPTFKVFTQFFFKKIVGSRGKAPVAPRTARNPLRPSQRAKYPRRARREIPARRSGRNPPRR